MKLSIKKYVVVIILCLNITGCSLLAAPVSLVQAPLTAFGQLLKLASKIPLPPPGVFF